ncbi:glyceraldehyde 3-phosphate dehydrogenase NAD-binding domain-containing protein [Spartinivicinus poritis]|uniref:Glyceraldehyde 3-phosphate dehydrogenase NAD(P) binding domain-containing protein n=1 Tax=Spartinivicinus poritis TaxID=2994640 RepID=A0ABT5U6N5_9GAMM|nr:glyceraldehyde 3-phosphate dehydrogenase NAD-binding domain-containing protein [Spartinivicinus sp. A2-2]MDE1461972.1 hypothetical protein [Spartinivicinus sp. A2-2]
MAVKVGIYGFNGLSRLAIRAAWEWPEVEFVLVNDASVTPEQVAWMLKQDSSRGCWQKSIAAEEKAIRIDNTSVACTQFAKISEIPWRKLGVDIVLVAEPWPEEVSLHALKMLLPKAILTRPVEQVLALVMGVNDHLYSPHDHSLISALSASCHMVAPVFNVLLNGLGIKYASFYYQPGNNTVSHHLSPQHFKHRLSYEEASVYSQPTWLADELLSVFPGFKHQLAASAHFLPSAKLSQVHGTFLVECKTTVAEVNSLLDKAARGRYRQLLSVSHESLWVNDLWQQPYSVSLEAAATQVVGSEMVSLTLWADEQWMYAHRLMELVRKVGAATTSQPVVT